ncbi:MAG TPA: exonuclease domain-containing protein [Syntrophorhabdaceae bacterium]|jgi:DNA polymerase-3 subunit epsilon
MYDSDLAIVDIETTGLSARFNRIIEIAILKVRGAELVESYSTLVDPEMIVSPYIETLTGITNEDLRGAPTFATIRDDLMGLLDGALFVAHNARFDYGFLREEFRREGVGFSPRCLCTLRLSRLLFPECRRHSLDRIMERFGITCTERHRALGDATVVWDFMKTLHDRFQKEELTQAVAKLCKTPIYPPLVEEYQIRNLPETAGVYMFYSQEGTPLYVGKSTNIKGRVLGHFSDGHGFVKEAHIHRQVADIKAVPTAGELGALLLEARLIKELQPLYNRRSKGGKGLIAAVKTEDASGYGTILLKPASDLSPEAVRQTAGIFKTLKQAKEYLWHAASEHRLCPCVLGLEKGKGPCSYRQLEKCEGPCEGVETPLRYNMRFIEALEGRSIRTWPFAGPILIEERAEGAERGEAFIIDQWCLLASFEYDEQGRRPTYQSAPAFDHDIYKIILHYFRRPGKKLNLREISRADLENL